MEKKFAQGHLRTRWTIPFQGLRLLFARTWFLKRWGGPHMGAPWWRWYWNPDPGMRIRHGQQAIDLGPLSLVVIPPETDFSGELESPCRHLALPFMLSEAFAVRGLGPQVIPLNGWEPIPLPTLWDQLAVGTPADSATAPTALAVQVTALLTASLAQLPTDAWSATTADPRLKLVLSRLRSDCIDPPSNSQLAEEAGLHPGSLVRLFKAQTGTTPQQYALRLRLEGASESLLVDGLTADAAATKWGFADRQHLTKAMRKHFHCSPGELRRQAMA